ncbi:MAG: acetyl-CoA carboxylase carboxyltransferase subunit alpha [Lachnospiraceae bacterium]|nr:acetyl-CoA carboxylase carboxyltransferase subunit alpha [Lachnospiraceae bacterium]
MLLNRKKEAFVSIHHTKDVPSGLLRQCRKCKSVVLARSVRELGYVCPKCGGYFRLHARRAIEMLADAGSFEPWFEGMEAVDPIDFPGYVERVSQLREKTGLDEAVICGLIRIEGYKTAIAVMDGRFLMASMGRIVGEKITAMVERATGEDLPVIILTCSGGARMQEGIVSLMQMAKTSAALKRHHESGKLYVSVLMDPTTGGVTASFAMLGDIILAEPNALIGFAGPRVVEQTIGEKLPNGFQRAEHLLEHGFVDRIVERCEMKKTLAGILKMHAMSETPKLLQNSIFPQDPSERIVKKMCDDSRKAWDRVLISRKTDRPVAVDYIERLFDDFMELHGDRCYRDDPAIIGGIALFHGHPVTVIAQAKGRTTKENIKRNFGMPNPDGYRKSLRLMKQAEKFGRPIFCMVDTPGAFCGIEAEQRGQGEAIARNLFTLSDIKTPIVSLVIGEGGSGGALALAVADKVWMLENAVYSILSPEGYASILLKDAKLAPDAAAMMKLTSADLFRLKVIDRIFDEPEEYTTQNMDKVIRQLDHALLEFVEQSREASITDIVQKRYDRFRNM